jgi:excisionase family DNA binding protein
MSVAVRPNDPAAFVATAREAISHGERIRLRVGEAECEVDGEIAEGLVSLMGALISGAATELLALPDELTTGQAADLLGVSRPTVVSLVDRGDLGARRIGSHRRLNTAEVLAYREQRRTERHRALDEVASLSSELGLYDVE